MECPELPFTLESDLERKISQDEEWLRGIEWGVPRPGHPEGKVKFHILDVLNNVDRYFGANPDRSSLRLITLIHDTFKYQRAQRQLNAHCRTHGYWARMFAERYVSDVGVIKVIELHDDAYRAHRMIVHHGEVEAGKKAARELIRRLSDELDLFMRFYWCDSQTGNKTLAHYEWFRSLVEQSQR